MERIPFISQDDFCAKSTGNEFDEPRREYSINVFIRRHCQTFAELNLEDTPQGLFSCLLGDETIITKSPLHNWLLPDGVVSPVPDEFWLKPQDPSISVNNLLPNEPHSAGWSVNYDDSSNFWFHTAYGITMDGYHVHFYTNEPAHNALAYAGIGKHIPVKNLKEKNAQLRESFKEKFIDACAYLGVRRFEVAHLELQSSFKSSVWMGKKHDMEHGIRVEPLWGLNSARYSQIKPITNEEFNSLPTWIFAHGDDESVQGSFSLLKPTGNNLSIPEAAFSKMNLSASEELKIATKEKINLIDWMVTQKGLKDAGKESFYSYVDAIHLIRNRKVFYIDLKNYELTQLKPKQRN